MKKLLVILLVMLLAFSFAACGEDPAAPTDDGSDVAGTADNGDTVIAGSLIEKTAMEDMNSQEHPVYVKYNAIAEGVSTEGFWVADGDKMYSETSTPEGRAGTLIDGEEVYIIMHDQKMYMKSGTAEGDIMPAVMEEGEEEFDSTAITKGTEEYNGATYISESITEDGSEVKYLFDQDTEDWKYLLSDDMVMEILEISDNADNSLLSIPAGYTELAY